MKPAEHPFEPLEFVRLSEQEQNTKIDDFYQSINRRRSVRAFSSEPVSKLIIEKIIKSASTAPSGAHKQPWTFCAVSDPKIKAAIQSAAEEEEYLSYHGRMSEEWLEDLKPLQTDWHKPFLSIAPWLIVVFKQSYGLKAQEKQKHYYVNESVGIACGILLTAIHQAGLVSLTHTPSPMNFLQKILDRPENEKPFLLIPVGYPAADTQVPKLTRKPLSEIAVFYE